MMITAGLKRLAWMPVLLVLVTSASVFAFAPAKAFEDSEHYGGEPLRLALIDGLNGQSTVLDTLPARAVEDLRTLYAVNDHRPLWIDRSAALLPSAHRLIAAFARAGEEGLDPARYSGDLLERRLATATRQSRVDADLLLSATALAYARDLRLGLVDPYSLGIEVDLPERPFDAPMAVLSVAHAADQHAALARLAPPHRAYRDLRVALVRARETVAAGGWPSVPAGETLRPGDVDDRVPALRARLAATGEYTVPAPVPASDTRAAVDDAVIDDAVIDEAVAGEAVAGEAVAGEAVAGDAAEPDVLDPNVFDDDLVAAVEAFQEHHGLAVDGVVGPRTLAAMNVDAETRVGQVIATMERWRWLPDDLGDTHIVVNLPDYHLELVEDDIVTRRMKAIIGLDDRQTPLFSSALTWLEFNPTWTMPTSIAYRDYLPKLLEDPAVLDANNIRLYSSWSQGASQISAQEVDWQEVGTGIRGFMLRQDPGPGNALGKVKFMMANSFSVYLHDTPSRYLFDRARRSYSSGCVRVEDPIWLADYLLQDHDLWSGRRDRVLNGWTTTRFNLPEPVPLHLVYHTAWIDASDRVVYREDVYGIDAMVLEAMEGDDAVLTQLASVQ